MDTEFVYPYGPKLSPSVDCSEDVVLVQQSFGRESDINYVVGQYVKTGVMPVLDPLKAVYGECPAITYHEAMNLVIAAEEAFLTVPAAVRARFGNDPGAFTDFVMDPANAAELVQLGLVDPPAERQPFAVDVPAAETPKA